MKIEYVSPEIEIASVTFFNTNDPSNESTNPGGDENETPFVPFSLW